MSSKKLLNVSDIIERAKFFLGIKTDRELAILLNLKPVSIAAWRRRGSLDLDSIITLCISKSPLISTDWLIFGKGSPIPVGVTDSLSQKIFTMLDDMTEEQKRDVLKYVEKEKLLNELIKERKKEAA